MPKETQSAVDADVGRPNAKSFLTRKLSTEEKERVADIVIYLGIFAPTVFLAIYGNLQVVQVIGANAGVPHATLITSLIEADSVLGAFLAAMFVIRYELTKMWREEDRKKAEDDRKKADDETAERRHQESRVV